MLRDDYLMPSSELQRLISLYDVHGKLQSVTSFRVLDPDTFIWRLWLDDGIYYLYAQDYPDSMTEIEEHIKELSSGKAGHFVHLKSAPLKPENVAFSGLEDATRRWNKHPNTIQTESGFDKIFLYKSDEEETGW